MRKYAEPAKPRELRTAPHITLKVVRWDALGLTMDQVIERIKGETGRVYTRGMLSAIENGHRGPSDQALADITMALGLPAGSCSTDYQPRAAAASGDETDVA